MSEGVAAVSRGRYIGRALVLVVATGYMLWGPISVQGFGGRSPIAVPWMMFHGVGGSICRVEYRDRSPDGDEKVIDRFERLGHGFFLLAPWSVRNVRGPEHARALGARLCAASPTGDVRAHGTCAEQGRAWRLPLRGDENLCEAPAREAKMPDEADLPPWSDRKPY